MTEQAFPRISLEAARAIAQTDPMSREIGFDLIELTARTCRARMTVKPKYIAPNGFMHAAISTLFADLTCGFGSAAALREPATRFATLDIQTHHLGTATAGTLLCAATAKHVGSRTQVWDGEVSVEATGKVITLFRCTQMALLES